MIRVCDVLKLMFNFQQVNILFLFFFIYILQTLVLLAVFSIYGIQNQNSVSVTKVYFIDYSIKYIVNFLILSFAGMPPILMFFFKVFIFLNVNTTFNVLVMLIIINTCVLFYYINFLAKLDFEKKLKKIIIFKKSKLFVIRVSVHMFIVNTFGFFILNYFGFLI